MYTYSLMPLYVPPKGAVIVRKPSVGLPAVIDCWVADMKPMLRSTVNCARRWLSEYQLQARDTLLCKGAPWLCNGTTVRLHVRLYFRTQDKAHHAGPALHCNERSLAVVSSSGGGASAWRTLWGEPYLRKFTIAPVVLLGTLFASLVPCTSKTPPGVNTGRAPTSCAACWGWLASRLVGSLCNLTVKSMFPLAPSVTDSTVGLVSLAMPSVDALYSGVVAGASVVTGPGAAQQPAA